VKSVSTNLPRRQVYHPRRTLGSRSERRSEQGRRHEVPVRREPVQR